MYMFDIETLDVESTSVILSAAAIKFDPNDLTKTYQDYLDEALFVKFDVKEQMRDYNRTVSKDTMQWWSEQHDYVRKVSFVPSSDDLSVSEGLDRLIDYVKVAEGDTIWSRGSLDQMAIDSLCKVAGKPLIAPYFTWRDVRTALDCLTQTSKNGYCKIKGGFDSRSNVIKHHPTHDCAFDIMMLLHGE